MLPIFLSANFIAMNSGARSLGMGNAFVALSDGGSAVFYNPAGLARSNQFSISGSLQKLYGISDLTSSMASISFPTPIFRTNIAVQQINLLDTYSEQILYLSAASIIKPKNIPEIIYKSDLVISGGGYTKVEAAYLSKPVIPIPIHFHQIETHFY